MMTMVFLLGMSHFFISRGGGGIVTMVVAIRMDIHDFHEISTREELRREICLKPRNGDLEHRIDALDYFKYRFERQRPMTKP